MGKLSFAIVFLIFFGCRSNIDLEELDFIDTQGNEILTQVFEEKDKYELQIIYTQVNRGEDSSITFIPHKFNVNSDRYFYPASTVKMPVAFLALEKINNLEREGFDINYNTSLQIGAPRSPPQSPVNTDSSSLNNLASIAHYVHKVFLVSNNDAYNRLYEFVGPESINRSLRDKGIFSNSRIIHRVGISGFGPEENRHTNPFEFFNESGLVYEQAAQYMEEPDYEKLEGTLKGVARMDDEGKIIREPFDFSQKNFVNLEELQKSMMGIFFPDQMGAATYDLESKDYELLYKSMSMRPRESQAPRYADSLYYDSYVKLFMFGDSKAPIPEHIRIFNKVGFAYGFLTDCAYIVDFKNKVDFFLAATIHVNENQTYNDGVYEYEEIGTPFLSELGRNIYEYELGRERKVEANLERFQVEYE